MRKYWVLGSIFLGVILLVVIRWEGDWESGPYVHISGPDQSPEIMEKIYAGGEKKQQVIEWLGEPLFAFGTSSGEILIFRRMVQATSKRERFYGLFEPEIYYRSYETIFLLEFLDGRMAQHRLVKRSYPRPATEVEFGLDDSLSEFIGALNYGAPDANWSTGGAKSE